MKMQKKAIIIVLMLVVTNVVLMTKADFQTVGITVIDDSFENWHPESITFPPTNWSVYNVNGGQQWSRRVGNMRTGLACARCQYDSSNTPNDDWFTTKGTYITSESINFSVWIDTYQNMDDEYEIYMSTSGNAVSDFTGANGTLLQGVYYPVPTVYTFYSFNMSSYEGQTVWFAIRYIGNYAWYCYADDFTFPDGATEGFEGIPAYWDNWSQVVVTGTDPDNKWAGVTTGTYPTCTPHEGSYMARYNCYAISTGNSNRLYYNDIINASGNFQLSFWMYHSTQYSDEEDAVEVQKSDDLNTWETLDVVYRYDDTEGWQYHVVSLPQGSYYIGLLGVSDYGFNIFLDEFMIVRLTQLITNELPTDETQVSLSLEQLSVDIFDFNGDLMNWTIQCSNGDNSTGSSYNGSICCNLTALGYNTTYTWWVNVTDGGDWTNATYTFTTGFPPPPTNISVIEEVPLEVSISWDKGNESYRTVIIKDNIEVIYNDTGTSYLDSSNITRGITYLYNFYSYDESSKEYSIENLVIRYTAYDYPYSPYNEPVVDGGTVTLPANVYMTGKPRPDDIIWTENFDSYYEGQYLDGDVEDNGWDGWYANSSKGATVSDDYAYSGSNSIEILQTPEKTTDLMYKFIPKYDVLNSGRYTITAWQYIPSNFTGQSLFYVMGAYFNEGMGDQWNSEIMFDGSSDTVHVVSEGISYPLIREEWVEIRLDIDSGTTDYYRVYYGGILIWESQWTYGPLGDWTGALAIEAIGLYSSPSDTNRIYYDDLSLETSNATLWFEYGTTTEYGNKTDNVSATEGIYHYEVLSDLEPNLYYYRWVVDNGLYRLYSDRYTFLVNNIVLDNIYPYYGGATTVIPTCSVQLTNIRGTPTDLYWYERKIIHGSEILRPVANGSYSDWIPVNTTSNYEAVDEEVSDGDATYISAPAGHLYYDSYLYEDPVTEWTDYTYPIIDNVILYANVSINESYYFSLGIYGWDGYGDERTISASSPNFTLYSEVFSTRADGNQWQWNDFGLNSTVMYYILGENEVITYCTQIYMEINYHYDFYELQQINNDVGNGTYTWVYENASDIARYYWKVFADDGEFNNTITYTFGTATFDNTTWSNHKMHHPQYPDPNGIDYEWVSDAPPENWMFDDWECSETGNITDIHFWISSYDDVLNYSNIQNLIEAGYLRIWITSNIPEDDPSNPVGGIYAVPNVSDSIYYGYPLLSGFNVSLSGPWMGVQDWMEHDFNDYYYENHMYYYRVDIVNITGIAQSKNTIYWLGVSWSNITEHMLGMKSSVGYADMFGGSSISYNTQDGVNWDYLATNYDLAFVITGMNVTLYPWDLNDDGLVNYLDVSTIVTNYGSSGPRSWITSDIDDNGLVNYLDISSLVSHYGENYIVEETVILRPTGDSSISLEWSSTEGTHYEAVDDVISDNDSTYIYETLFGSYDFLTLTPDVIPDVVEVSEVTVFAEVAVNNSSNMFLVLTDGYYNAHSDLFNIASQFPSFETIQWTFATNPSGGSWTRDDLDTLEVGIMSQFPSDIYYCTQIYVQIKYLTW